MPEFIIVDGPQDGIATITLNRPGKKNALSIALRDEITATLDGLYGPLHDIVAVRSRAISASPEASSMPAKH